MELLLWRWSTGAQIVSALILAIFFAVFSRSVKRVELRPWTRAWFANLAALVATVVFWFAQPDTRVGFGLNMLGYVFFKTTFVVLLAAGASEFSRTRLLRWRRRYAAAIAVYALIVAVSVRTIDELGVVQSAAMLTLFAMSAWMLLFRAEAPAARWLAAGFVLRALLSAAETAAHGLVLWGHPDSTRIRLFLASYSAFDTAAEWVIALGCVLMLYARIQAELTDANDELLTAQEVMRAVADRDPMTGLENRRALPAIFREVFSTGATLLFFDLNEFKQINDTWGHHAGDECLRLFAGALQSSFRPDDHIVRYAGDEFLVVTGALPEKLLEERLENMRRHLAMIQEEKGGAPIKFSVGRSHLHPAGDPDEAIRAADEAMYHDKAAKKAAR
jgi:diguanylate cyclase (GGDEF)-like protein